MQRRRSSRGRRAATRSSITRATTGGGRCGAYVCASGSRTVNVEPWPVPSLAAATVPPCASTSARTTASPTPSPGAVVVARNPFPFVLHRNDHPPAVAGELQRDGAARRCVLEGVADDVRKDLRHDVL